MARHCSPSSWRDRDKVRYRTRDAASEDEPWLEGLRRRAYADLFDATWGGWDEERHSLQFSAFMERGNVSIIEVEGERVGMLQLLDTGDALEVSEIQVDPRYQSRGLGTSVLMDVVSDARARGSDVRLSVGLQNERAIRLYERLGFEVVGSSATHLHMWHGRTDEADPLAAPAVVSRARWATGLLVGTLLWAVSVFVAHSFPVIFLGRELEGSTYAIVALLFAPLALGAVSVGLRLARTPLAAAGFTLERARADVSVGAAIAVIWAVLQFFVFIPLTGGAERADLVVNAEQIGPTLSGLGAFLLLAWGGGFAEEVFFRAHLMTTLRGIFGPSRVATAIVVLVPTLLFAMLHGYQGGWIGMLDTGAFGGATLSLLFLWRGRLLPCVVAHGLWNTIASVVIFVRY